MANKIVKEQIDKAFKNIGEIVKSQFSNEPFVKNVLQSEEKTILTGVGNINDLDIPNLDDLERYDNRDEISDEHIKHCDACKEELYCPLLDEAISESDLDYCYFYKGELNPKAEEETFDKCSLVIYADFNSGYYQVIKSPQTEKHGLCSLCYLGQADLDSDGEYETYVIPDEYRSDKEDDY